MIDLNSTAYGFEDLRQIMALLRQPGGCPWDAAQTHQSIRKNFLEEAYEVCEAIDQRDNSHLCEELGDALLQVVFHTRIAEEAGAFTMEDVCTGICKKLIFRHPHIFADGEKLTKPEETLAVWDLMKAQEKQQETGVSAMNDVAKCLPALTYAEKIQSRAARWGVDWQSARAVMDKLLKEAGELQSSLSEAGDIEETLGDLLFASVALARKKEIDPEEALFRAAQKFMRRFAWMEQAAGDKLSQLNQKEMTALWQQAKQEVKPYHHAEDPF